MGTIVVSPLGRIAEMAVRHKCREMLSLMAQEQAFHRPGIIDANRHLLLAMNDIAFAGTGGLVAPAEEHVTEIIAFARAWDRSAPLLVHCWMGVSRSPAAALVAALAVAPDQDDMELAQRLRAASPYATPNSRIVEIGDRLLSRRGRLVAAVKAIGRGRDADGNAPFVFSAMPDVYPSPPRGEGAQRADEGVSSLASSQPSPSSDPAGHLLPAGEKGEIETDPERPQDG